ncbi:MAG: glycogen/starch/alpha-glucan phosphorylase [Pseudomonadota bacterium]
MTPAEFRTSVLRHLKYAIGKDEQHASTYDWRLALTMAVRDQIVDRWVASTKATYDGHEKRVYYLSMEFLVGRLLEDAISNLRLMDVAHDALHDLGLDLKAIVGNEPDAALGNGGLGRLAACFMESLATLGVPAYGYGIRYEHGLFRQRFEGGRQVEEPEDWLRQMNPWEFIRPEAAFEIGFGGHVHVKGVRGVWRPSETVVAEGHDTPIVGWKGHWANTLRLWASQPTQLFDLDRFNRGDYAAAAAPEALARTISRVLYPDDTTTEGKALRLKQEYFFTAASLHDIIRRFETAYHDLRELPTKVAIQLNDTHPAIAGPELVRILLDERGMAFEDAVDTARYCLSYTNHTLLPEALERWPEDLMRGLLPRHVQIIEMIDGNHAKQYPSRAVAIRDNGQINMGELSFIMAHKVNGVSALHTELMKKTVFNELHTLHPDRIVSQTNGVTPRRWVLGCNPRLAKLITETIGPDWIGDAERLAELDPAVKDPGFLERYAEIKAANKSELSNWLSTEFGFSADPRAIFDVQIKRMHEYKRQHLNILEAIALWQEIRDNPDAGWPPRVKIFAGKAAPGYVFAKEIIHLINSVAAKINADPVTSPYLKVIFAPNYNVTLAERLIPASDLSEQISTAGKEASGTGNMKFAMNGALTIGTLDGANVEIRERVGAENFFLFGMTADEVIKRRNVPNHAAKAIAAEPKLGRAIATLRDGTFSPDQPGLFAGIADNVSGPDYFLISSDFADYWRAQREVDRAFADAPGWAAMAAHNTARSGWFSSDRTIRGYLNDVWNADIASAMEDRAAE